MKVEELKIIKRYTMKIKHLRNKIIKMIFFKV